MSLLKNSVTLLALSSALLCCDKTNDAGNLGTTSAPAPDNTRVNARDDAQAATAMDQGNGRADLDVTQAIRKAVMADDSLSTDAKNVKIITAGGVVTLRGPVKTAAERQNVDAKAKAAAGANRVDDQLDIETK